MAQEVVIEDEAPIVPKRVTKSARVKGTWHMYFGAQEWDFHDGRRYDLPVDLFEYLKQHDNLYDTM